MNPLRPSLLESNPSSIQPNQVAQNIFRGDTAPARVTAGVMVLTVLSAMFPRAFLLRGVWRGLWRKGTFENGMEVFGIGMTGSV